MASIRPIQLTTGDTRPWKFTLKDETGAAVDVTSGTVTLSMRLRGATTNKIDNSGLTLTDATNGIVTYDPTSANVDTQGTYDLEIKIVDSASDVQHNFELIKVEIREALTE